MGLNSIAVTKGAALTLGALRRNEIAALDLSGRNLGPMDAMLLAAALATAGGGRDCLTELVLDRNQVCRLPRLIANSSRIAK